MKYFLLLTIVAVAVAQDSTGNPLTDVQYGAEAIHQMFEGTFDNVRFYSSDVLNEQNNVLLNVALDTIASWGPVAESVAQPEQVTCGCGCSGNCGAVVADQEAPEAVDGSAPVSTGCTSCGCSSGNCGSAVAAGPVVGEESLPASTGCTSCGCSSGNCAQVVAEPVEVRLRKMMATFNTAAIGEATRACIDTARKTLQDRQEAILAAIEVARYQSTELQLKALAGLENFNLLLDFDSYYDTMTPAIFEHYSYLTNVRYGFSEFIGNITNRNSISQEVNPRLEILVGDLEFNRDTLAISMQGCLDQVAKRHL